MNDILNTILETTYSLTQLKHRVRLLKSYLEKAIFSAQAKEENANQADLNWLNSLPDNFFKNFNKDNIYQIFQILEPQIAKLPVLIIYLAFEADDQVLSQLGPMVRKTQQNPHLLIDVKVDPDILAGCALSWKGMYKDYSLRAKIEEKKSEIMENFKQFLR